MKNKFLAFIFILFATQVIAQEEIVIEQIINEPIRELNIHAGWDVRLIQTDDSKPNHTRIAIVTADAYEEQATNTRLCKFHNGKLTLLENTTMPMMTIVEIQGDLQLEYLTLYDNAFVTADRFVAESQKPKCSKLVFLHDKATLHIGHFQSPEDSHILTYFNSKLSIDTLSGKNVYVDTYGSQLEFGENLLSGNLVVSENQPHYFAPLIPEGQFVDAKYPYIQNDTIRHIEVIKYYKRIWNHQFAIELRSGLRLGQQPSNALGNSAYNSRGDIYFDILVGTGFRLNNKWSAVTGLKCDATMRLMTKPVSMFEAGLTNNMATESESSTINTHYLSIPIEFYRSINKNLTLGADLSFGHIASATLRTRDASNSLVKENAIDAFNPWKIEAGFSIRTSALGIFHGIRVFTNILPEYKFTKNTPSIGIELIF